MVANFYANSVGLVSSAGSVVSGGGYTGGGMNAPRAIAVDGSATHGLRANAVLHWPFSSASSARSRDALSPSAGMGNGCETARALFAGDRRGGKYLGVELRLSSTSTESIGAGCARQDSAARARPHPLRATHLSPNHYISRKRSRINR